MIRTWSAAAIAVAGSLALSVACDEPTSGGGTPNYVLLLAPAAVNVPQGTSPTISVSIDRTNFTGGVALFLTGAPGQVTGSFAPQTTNTTASTLTLTVGSGVTPGNYTLVVNGNGAPGARTTPLPLTVTAAPNYALEVTPATLSISRGGSDSAIVDISRSNFGSPVTLGLIGLPSGATSSFDPASPATSTSRLTLNVSGATNPGTYNLTVTGNASIGDREAALQLIVVP